MYSLSGWILAAAASCSLVSEVGRYAEKEWQVYGQCKNGIFPRRCSREGRQQELWREQYECIDFKS